MTKLNDTQAHLLEMVKDSYQAVLPVLDQLEAEYQYAVYRAKKAVQDAVSEALEAGVPMTQLSKEAAGFTYAQKLEKWLDPHPSVRDRLDSDLTFSTADTYKDSLDQIEAVTRDAQTGKILVTYMGDQYTINAFGPDEAPWAERVDSVPLGVYDLIREKFTGFVDLGEED